MKQSPTVQKDPFGCGAACIAFLTNRGYEEIVNLLGKNKAKKVGFYLRELCQLLRKLGYNCEYHYLTSKWRKNIYKEGTIVFIGRSKKYPYGHYLIRHKNFWMDPWINFPKNKNISQAKAGFRRRLPGKAIYAVFINPLKQIK
ncbi:MAG: hypothetical protein KQA38_02510 [Candidatus Aenigmarchaeota archaeon]|nr:hypothetical protein [Candidatus Aenigmarchaeota archaeon]